MSLRHCPLNLSNLEFALAVGFSVLDTGGSVGDRLKNRHKLTGVRGFNLAIVNFPLSTQYPLARSIPRP